MQDFAGLSAVITGGSGGIGAATAALLLERGAKVAVLDLATEGAPQGTLALAVDITDQDQVDAAVSTIVRDHGGIDVLVNNAGIGAVGDITENDWDEWNRVLGVNVVAVARVTAAVMPFLRASQHAAVVNMSSAVVHIGVAQRALYSASKGALHALTLAMAADHVREGVRVNAVAPGTTETPWIARLLDQSDAPEAARAALRGRQPLGRLVAPEEVAHAVASLASPLAASTTGVVLRVDGGMTTLRV